MTLISYQINLLGHWGLWGNLWRSLSVSHSQIHFEMQISPCTSLGEIHTPCLLCAPTGGYYPPPALGWGDLKPTTELCDSKGGSGHLQSVTWVTDILTTEMGLKLTATKSASPPVLSRCPQDGDRQEVWVYLRFLDKVLPTLPFPIGCSHQDLFPSLWQPKSNQATPNERSGSQKDGYHFGNPNKRSEDGVSQDSSKFA